MAHPNSKFTDKQKEEIVERYILGETFAKLAKEYEVSVATIRKVVRDAGAYKPAKTNQGPRSSPAAAIAAFTHRARSILWRQESGNDKNKKSYHRWNEAIKELKTNGNYTQHQAVVQVSKDFSCLRQLFREYNVSEYDPNPGSHPKLEGWGEEKPFMDDIKNENREQSFRENLAWATEAAGKFLRTSELPTSTPNDSAFFLFKQACEQPKEFMAKFVQVEGRGDVEEEKRQRAKRTGLRAIDEINEMIAELDTWTDGASSDTEKS